MSIWFGPMCLECRHLSATDTACTAFPQGLPVEIAQWRHDHRLPFPGDGGVTFEPRDPGAWETSPRRELADEIFGVPAEAAARDGAD